MHLVVLKKEEPLGQQNCYYTFIGRWAAIEVSLLTENDFCPVYAFLFCCDVGGERRRLKLLTS